MGQNDENDVQRADLTPYIDAIMERYRPAETAREATLSLSTADVYRALRTLTRALRLAWTMYLMPCRPQDLFLKRTGLPPSGLNG